jgi:diguanylate cyclase (GGDEF)-like protein
VRALLPARDGSLWVGTEDVGLYRREGQAFRRFAGLADFVGALHEDATGTIWVGTEGGGLCRIRDGRLRRFTIMEGLRDDVVNSSWRRPTAATSGSSRTAASPAWPGTSWRHPARIPRDETPPRVVVEELWAGGQPLASRGPVVLGPGRPRIEIRSTAPTFRAPRRLRFRFRLVGLDRDRVEAGARRTAYYTDVPPGRYRFEVAARSAEGVWSRAPATLDRTFRPRFFESRWFFLAAGLHRARTRGLKRRGEELGRLVEERTRQLTEANESLRRLTVVDALTGVATRRRFEDALEVEWRRCHRAWRLLGLVLADIDHFKACNDRCGHPRGDECLRQVAAALAGGARRASDLVARCGGEEFLALLPDTDQAGTAAVAETLRTAVRALAIPHEGSPLGVVTVSLGAVSFVPGRTDSPGRAPAAADRALYRAEAAGRDQVVLGDEQGE